MQTQAIVVDSQELTREGLRSAMERSHTFTSVTCVAGANDARALLSGGDVALIVLAAEIADGRAYGFCRELRRDHPELAIAIMSAKNSDQHLFSSLNSGASAYIPQTLPLDEIVALLRAAAHQPRSFTARDMAAAMEREARRIEPRLSPRELDVLALLVDGRTAEDIAKTLRISKSTAKTHITKTYEKMGVANRAQLVVMAIQLGLVDVDLPPQPTLTSA